MKFALIVQAAPDSPFAKAALQSSQSIWAADHVLTGAFFLGQGVLNIQTCNSISMKWRDLFHNIDQEALCCAAAIKRFAIPSSALIQCSTVAGLGQMIELCLMADRVLTFGSRKQDSKDLCSVL